MHQTPVSLCITVRSQRLRRLMCGGALPRRTYRLLEGAVPQVRASPPTVLGRRPNQGQSPLKLTHLRRGVAPPHIRRRSRYEPNPSVAQQRSRHEPNPSVAQQRSRYEPNPSVAQQRSRYQPNPSVAQRRSRYQPNPSVAQRRSRHEPNPSVAQQRSRYEPKPQTTAKRVMNRNCHRPGPTRISTLPTDRLSLRVVQGRDTRR